MKRGEEGKREEGGTMKVEARGMDRRMSRENSRRRVPKTARRKKKKIKKEEEEREQQSATRSAQLCSCLLHVPHPFLLFSVRRVVSDLSGLYRLSMLSRMEVQSMTGSAGAAGAIVRADDSVEPGIDMAAAREWSGKWTRESKGSCSAFKVMAQEKRRRRKTTVLERRRRREAGGNEVSKTKRGSDRGVHSLTSHRVPPSLHLSMLCAQWLCSSSRPIFGGFLRVGLLTSTSDLTCIELFLRIRRGSKGSSVYSRFGCFRLLLARHPRDWWAAISIAWGVVGTQNSSEMTNGACQQQDDR